MTSRQAKVIMAELDVISGALDAIHDLQVGRDTHPLFDDTGSVNAMSFHVATTLARTVSEVLGLHAILENYAEFVGEPLCVCGHDETCHDDTAGGCSNCICEGFTRL